MKRLMFSMLIFVSIFLFVSCGGAETKADSDGTEKNESAPERTAEKEIADDKPAAATVPKPDSTSLKPGSNEILSKIDIYLVSTPVYTAPASGSGIVNATMTIKNKLADITFQKAIVEVTVLAADGKELRNDYYPIQNIEPGDVETIKLPNIPKAASLVSHIVKVKSNQLTNGEMVLVGTHFEPGK
ncbi:MAG: hypothetical protein ACT4OJ_01880 [Bacteroidota bacterium]